jgi:D-3-phosphoglycerate dehydrogenase
MSDIVEPLILDLLEWVAGGERAYLETMDAWRTSCPRLPVWEDANARGLVTRIVRRGTPFVAITPAGRALLVRAKRRPALSSS